MLRKRYKTNSIKRFTKFTGLDYNKSCYNPIDGEISIIIKMTFQLEAPVAESGVAFIVLKNQRLNWPHAETPTSYITMGFNEDLNEAIDIAINNMINILVNQKHLTRNRRIHALRGRRGFVIPAVSKAPVK
jgi:acetamidase/formamidase